MKQRFAQVGWILTLLAVWLMTVGAAPTITKRLIEVDDFDLSQTDGGAADNATVATSTGGTMSLRKPHGGMFPWTNEYTRTIRPGDIYTKGPWADVRSFGAVPNLSDNATMTANVTAFRAALDASQNVFIPAGRWYLNGAIGHSRGLGGQSGQIVGAGRHNTYIEQTDNTANIFEFTTSNPTSILTIKSMTLYYGASSILINTNNNDTSTFNIEDIYFYKPATACIESGANAGSTLLNARGNVFVTSPTGMVAKKITGDYWFLDGNWVSSFGRVAFYNGQSTMDIRKTVGVPIHSAAYGNDMDNSVWVQNYGHLYLFDNRFAADDAKGSTLIENYAAIDAIIHVERNYHSTIDYYYKMFAIPEFMTIRDNYAYGGLGGTESHTGEMWFSPTATLTGAYRGVKNISDRQVTPAISDSSSREYANQFFARDYTNREEWSRNILFSDVIMMATANVGLTGTDVPTNGTVLDNVAYEYLGINSKQFTATSDNASLIFYNATWTPSTLTDGAVYTAVLDLVADVAAPVVMRTVFNYAQAFHRISKGTNIITQTYMKGPLSDDLWYFVLSNLGSGDKVRFGRLRIFLGKKIVDTVETVVTADNTATAASSSFIYWGKGDRWNYNNPTDNGYMGKVVTVAGDNTSAVWSNWGAIVP